VQHLPPSLALFLIWFGCVRCERLRASRSSPIFAMIAADAASFAPWSFGVSPTLDIRATIHLAASTILGISEYEFRVEAPTECLSKMRLLVIARRSTHVQVDQSALMRFLFRENSGSARSGYLQIRQG